MKFKLDENLGRKIKGIFLDRGYEVESVFDEKLQGSSDEIVYKICCEEKKCLVTLDLDFSDVIKFPPINSQGIVVIRLPKKFTSKLIQELVIQFLDSLDYEYEKDDDTARMWLNKENLIQNLWIVEYGRIRIHQKED